MSGTPDPSRLLYNITRKSRRSTGFSLWWLGHRCVLYQTQKRHVLIDPQFDDPPVLPLEECNFIDAICLTGASLDAQSPQLLKQLLETNPEAQLVAPTNILVDATDIGIAPEWILRPQDQMPLTVRGLQIIAQQLSTGWSYVLWLGPWTVAHAPAPSNDVKELGALSRWGIDAAVLGIDDNVHALALAEVADELRAGELLAMGSPGVSEAFVDECVELNLVAHALDIGQAYDM